MNNRARVDGVVCSFRVPPYAPAELDEPLARLEDLGARHTKTKTDLRALEQERVNRIAENVQARVAALTAGKEPPADKAPKIEAEIAPRSATVNVGSSSRTAWAIRSAYSRVIDLPLLRALRSAP